MQNTNKINNPNHHWTRPLLEGLDPNQTLAEGP